MDNLKDTEIKEEIQKYIEQLKTDFKGDTAWIIILVFLMLSFPSLEKSKDKILEINNIQEDKTVNE